MFFSVILLSSCAEEEFATLTPKEKFLKTGDNASNYFNGLAKALGMDTTLTPVTDGKMESVSASVSVNKSLNGAPFEFSAEVVRDVKNDAAKALCQLGIADEKVPVEVILTSKAAYFGIDKVTDRMIKVPLEVSQPATENSDSPEAINYTDYFCSFINSFSDDQFTVQTGKVTVDGMEFDAETVTLTASAKQFSEAVVKLLEKAKADLAISNSLTNYFGANTGKNYSELLDSTIERIKNLNITDSDQITVTVISENNVLRSFVFTLTKGEKKYSISFTATEKDSTNYVKGAVVFDEKEILKLNYEQKPNNKNSADGELTVSFDKTGLNNILEGSSSFYGTSELKMKFSGQKTGNRFSVDTKLEITETLSGVKITFPIDVAFEFEKVSDSEIKYSANLSADILNAQTDITLSGGRKIIDYIPVTVPADSKAEAFEEEKLDELIGKIMGAYPVIGNLIKNLNNKESISKMYAVKDGSSFIVLEWDGTGYLYTSLYDLTYKDGKYSAKLFDGSAISGEYIQDGDNYTIDGVPFFLEENDGYTYLVADPEIGNNKDTNIYFNGEECELYTTFTYTLDGETLTLKMPTGVERKLQLVKDGDSYTINGIKVQIN